MAGRQSIIQFNNDPVPGAHMGHLDNKSKVRRKKKLVVWQLQKFLDEIASKHVFQCASQHTMERKYKFKELCMFNILSKWFQKVISLRTDQINQTIKRPKQYDWHFADVILKCIFFKQKFILNKLWFDPTGPIETWLR